MNWVAFIAALPVNALMIFCIYLDLKEDWERKRRIQNKLDNLKRDNIYLDLSEDEKYMLDSLANLNSCSSYKEYLRKELKEIIKNVA